jgi:lysosomal alpha-mannosidase
MEYAINQSSHYQTNNIILTMGDDFQYTDATVNFYSMDKVIKLVQ